MSVRLGILDSGRFGFEDCVMNSPNRPPSPGCIPSWRGSGGKSQEMDATKPGPPGVYLGRRGQHLLAIPTETSTRAPLRHTSITRTVMVRSVAVRQRGSRGDSVGGRTV